MIQSKKTIIFCLSYLSVSWALQIIEDEGYENCIVITNIDSIEKLFRELYNPEFVYSTKISGKYILFFQERNPFKLISKLFFNIHNIIKDKRYFSNISEKNIYFFFTAFGVYESYLIKRLSKKNNVFYLPDVKMDAYSRDNSVKSKINRILIRIFYKLSVTTLKNGQSLVFALSNNFLQDISAKSFQLPDNLLKVKNKICELYKFKTAKILFLASGLAIKSGTIEQNEYINKTNKLLNYLTHKFGEQAIVIKTHPRFTKKYGNEKNFKEIPNYLPGNLIVHNFDIVIGFDSALLFESANENIIVYSTLDYYESNNNISLHKHYLNKNLNTNAHIIYIKDETEINIKNI